MILNEPTRTLLFQTEVVCWKGVHAVEYCEGVTEKGTSEFWKFTQNCYGEIACLLWCHIFNSYDNNPVHYRNLFGNDRLAHLGGEFKYEAVRDSIIESIALNLDSYKDFRAEVVKFRNKYVAHREYETESVIFPRINLVERMFLRLREILRGCTKEAERQDPEDIDLTALSDYFAGHTNDRLLKRCGRHVEQIQFF